MALDSVPAEIVQGTTHEWEASHSDYPASSWTLTYVFYSNRQRLTITGVASGNSWDVTLSKANSATLYAGPLLWQAFVSNSGNTERHLVAQGFVIVNQDVTNDSTPPIDPRSHARRMLEMLERLMENEALVKTMDPTQIAELSRQRWLYSKQVEVEKAAEKLRAGGYPTNKIFTRFA